MADEVKWIKLTTDMFSNSKIKALRRLPEGNNIVLIWVMLLTMAGKCNAGGMVIISENIPYTVEDLADDLHFEISTVKLALKALEEYRMIVCDMNGIAIKNWHEYQNVDGMERIREQTRKRVAEYKKRKKSELLEEKENGNVTGNVTVTQSSISISSSLSNSNSLSNSIKEIIDYLNITTNSNYKYNTKSTNTLIKARLGEGFTVEDFKTVIDKKWQQWKDDPKMVQYCRPATLFQASKFECYLNEKVVDTKPKSIFDEIAGV